MKPQYQHDCKYCEFIGIVEGYDLYICSQAGNPALFVREGRKREDYFTGVHLVLGRVNISLNATSIS